MKIHGASYLIIHEKAIGLFIKGLRKPKAFYKYLDYQTIGIENAKIKIETYKYYSGGMPPDSVNKNLFLPMIKMLNVE